AAMEHGLVHQEPRSRGVIPGQDGLAGQPRGQTLAHLVLGHARFDGQDAASVLLGLEQSRQDAELPDAQGRGLLLMFDPAAEPRRGGDPRAGLGVELAEPPVPFGERPVAHLREQLRRRPLAVLDPGDLPRVVPDPLPELRQRPHGRAPRPAHLLHEIPDGVARAIAHRRTPGAGGRQGRGNGRTVSGRTTLPGEPQPTYHLQMLATYTYVGDVTAGQGHRIMITYVPARQARPHQPPCATVAVAAGL